MDQLQNNLEVVAIVLSVISQLYVAAKTVFAGERVIKDLNDFKKGYEDHMKDYNNLERRVSFLEGKLANV